ncbi:MAG: hypothetical protein U5N86_09715 [Planctomycetota bacterium]|nr:hypothetical protein [Planctomycetota bacterium]
MTDKIVEQNSQMPREKCGVFGIFGNANAASITYMGLTTPCSTEAKRGPV